MENTAWAPNDVPLFLADYQSGLTDHELATKYGGTYDTVRKFVTKMRNNAGWPSRDEIAAGKTVEVKDDRAAVIAFMAKAKTRLEIERRFGTVEIVDRTFTGYNWFTDKNGHGETIYVLLPEYTQKIAVAPRPWVFHIPMSEQGDFPQGYMKINIPDSFFAALEGKFDEIRLVPLFDVHFGHHAHRADKFDEYLRYIAETPNVFVWGGGDLLENALDDGRGMSYEQAEHPERQIDVMIQKLAPIAHKIFFLQPGNHEWRTYNKAGIDPTQVICRTLDVPYFDGPVIFDILSAGNRWRLHSQHGTTNARTKGGKMNAAGAPRKWTNGVNFFVSGHVHDPVVASETVVDVDVVANRLVYLPQYTVIAPAFLGFEGTYAQRAGYSPPGLGGVSLSLYKDGGYEARLHNH